MQDVSRGEFLRRLALGTSLVAVPPSFLKLLRAKDLPVAAPAPESILLKEWWFESGEYEHITVQLASVVILEQHFIPPRSGVYVQFPVGREYEFKDLTIGYKMYPCEGYIDMPLRLMFDDGRQRAFVANTDGPELYAGVLAEVLT